MPLARRDDRFRRHLIPHAIDPIVLVVVLLEIFSLINAFVFTFGDTEFRRHAPVAARFEIRISNSRA